jgi:hypothetical protein
VSLLFRPAGIIAAALIVATNLGAQVVPRTVTGVVYDSAGRPLPGAAVALDPNGDMRGMRADAQGRFRFDNVAPGTHELRTVHIGYRPDDRTIDVPASGLEVRVYLNRLTYRLDTLVVRARRTGVLGTAIAKPGFRPMQRAIVEVLGTRWRVVTGPDGRFEFAEIPEGAWVVSVRRDGYKAQMIPVAVPAEGAVEVAAILDSLLTETDRRSERVYRDMASRINWRQRNTSAIVGAQELAGSLTLADGLRYAPSVIAKGLILFDAFVCSVYLNGKRETIHRLKNFASKDIGMIEVYSASGCAEPVPGRPELLVIRPSGKPGYIVWIWTK